jgi:hypothetical protein
MQRASLLPPLPSITKAISRPTVFVTVTKPVGPLTTTFLAKPLQSSPAKIARRADASFLFDGVPGTLPSNWCGFVGGDPRKLSYYHYAILSALNLNRF